MKHRDDDRNNEKMLFNFSNVYNRLEGHDFFVQKFISMATLAYVMNVLSVLFLVYSCFWKIHIKLAGGSPIAELTVREFASDHVESVLCSELFKKIYIRVAKIHFR